MPGLSVELLGKKKLINILSMLGKRVTNLKPAWSQIGDNFRAMEEMAFGAQGRPTQWRPLSPKYAAWKSKNYPGKPIMVLTGDLKNSLTSLGGDNINRISRQSIEMGTKDPKGDWHQHGRGRLKVRKVISPKASDITEWVNILRSYIVEKMGLRRSKF